MRINLFTQSINSMDPWQFNEFVEGMMSTREYLKNSA